MVADERNVNGCVRVGGMVVDRSSRAQLVDRMVDACRAHMAAVKPKPQLVFDCNGHALSMYAGDALFANAVDAADIVHADGQFVVWVSKILGAPIAERSATTDLIHDCARRAEQEGLSFYLLGGTEEVNSQVVQKLREAYPRLQISGRRNGYFAAGEEREVVDEINRAKPDVLWVGLGKPKEQIFCAKWASAIRASWVVTCGGCFNYITGHYSRAPGIMQRAGLEWVYRVAADPQTLFWRYLTTTPHALWLAASRSQRLARKC